MRKSRFSELQIISILKEVEVGVKVNDVCISYGISTATFYNWKSKLGGMPTLNKKRMQHLEQEVHRLMYKCEKLAHEKLSLTEVLSRKLAISNKCEVVSCLVTEHEFSVNQATAMVKLSRSTYYRKMKRT
jgi:putative transposase